MKLASCRSTLLTSLLVVVSCLVVGRSNGVDAKKRKLQKRKNRIGRKCGKRKTARVALSSSKYALKTFEGLKIPFGDGLTWNFIKFDRFENVQQVGVKFNFQTDFSSLPTSPSDGWWDARDADGVSTEPLAGHEYPLHFPQFNNKKINQEMMFQHVVTNWNPFGHGPPGVYTAPHFDFHCKFRCCACAIVLLKRCSHFVFHSPRALFRMGNE